MDPVADIVRRVLAPYVGAACADTCVRATALTLGKTSDSLTREDLPRLEESIRRTLGPVAPMATVDEILDEIRREAA